MPRINGVLPRIAAFITGFVFLVSAPVWAASTPEKIEIPKEFASAQEYHHAGPKLVIFIQDIHASVKVQQDIAGLIEHLVGKYGLKSVAYEGNEGVIDTEKVFWFPDAKLKKAVSEKFLQKLELSGPEFARINSKTPFQLSGMEDIKLYEKNLKLAKSALRVRQETLNVLKEIESLLIKSFEIAGSKESRKLFDLENSFRENRIGLPDYLQGLVEIYPDAEFTALLQSNKKMETIESREFFEKLESLRHKAEKVRYQKSLERDLSRSMENVRILKDMVNLIATRDQYHQYSQNPGQFKERYFRNLIRQALSRKEAFAQYEDTLDDLINVVADFYTLADARDQVMSDRLLKELDAQQTVIFVAGGFHTQGITERLRKENISYVLVQPKYEGREALAEKIYFNSLAEVSNDIAADSVFSIPSNKIPKKTKLSKDLEIAKQEVNEAVLAGAESGEFKVDPSLLREIALASGKSLGSAADWSSVLNRSLTIPPPDVIGLGIANDEKNFAAELPEIENKPVLKLAAMFSVLPKFGAMLQDKEKWGSDVQPLINQFRKLEHYSALGLFSRLEKHDRKQGMLKCDDEYARLLVNWLAETLRNESEYAEDIEALKATEIGKLSAAISDILFYWYGKKGVERMKQAALDGKLNREFIKGLPEHQFSNALVLLAKNRDQALLGKLRQTGPTAVDEVNWTKNLIEGLKPEFPQIALEPLEAVEALFILHGDYSNMAATIEILDMHANYRKYTEPYQTKLKETYRLAKEKYKKLDDEEKARIAARPKAIDRYVTEHDLLMEQEYRKSQRDKGKWRDVNGDGNLFEEVVGEEEVDVTPVPVPKAQNAGEVLKTLYGKLTNGMTPEKLAAKIVQIIRTNPKAKAYIVKFAGDAAKKGLNNIPAAKLVEVDQKLQSMLANGKSLGQRDRTILIQINSKEDILRYSTEAQKFLAATEKTKVVFLVAERDPKTNPNFVELRRKFKHRVEVVSNELLSKQNISDLNSYIFSRPGDFALIAPYETLERAIPLDGLLLLGAEDLKLKDQEMEKVPSALIDTALRALAAGTKDGEFLSRTRGLDNGRIFMVTSEYLNEWVSHLFAEHSYAQQFASAA